MALFFLSFNLHVRVCGFILAVNEVRPSVKVKHPGATVGELGKVMGAQWKELSEEDRAPFHAQAAEAREAYRAAGWSERMRALSIALQFYQHHSSSRDSCGALCAAYAKQADEQIRLL